VFFELLGNVEDFALAVGGEGEFHGELFRFRISRKRPFLGGGAGSR
jgi:hypothetical protein